MCTQRIYKIFLHQVHSGLEYTMSELTASVQLSVIEMIPSFPLIYPQTLSFLSLYLGLILLFQTLANMGGGRCGEKEAEEREKMGREKEGEGKRNGKSILWASGSHSLVTTQMLG